MTSSFCPEQCGRKLQCLRFALPRANARNILHWVPFGTFIKPTLAHQYTYKRMAVKPMVAYDEEWTYKVTCHTNETSSPHPHPRHFTGGPQCDRLGCTAAVRGTAAHSYRRRGRHSTVLLWYSRLCHGYWWTANQRARGSRPRSAHDRWGGADQSRFCPHHRSQGSVFLKFCNGVFREYTLVATQGPRRGKGWGLSHPPPPSPPTHTHTLLLGNLVHTFDFPYERTHSRRRNAHKNVTFSKFPMHLQLFRRPKFQRFFGEHTGPTYSSLRLLTAIVFSIHAPPPPPTHTHTHTHTRFRKRSVAPVPLVPLWSAVHVLC